MAIDPFGMFKAGQQVGKSKRSAAGMTTDTMFDQFNKRQEQNYAINKTLGTQMALKQFENQLPLNTKDQASVNKDNAMADAYRNGKEVYGMNPNTGELESQGNIGRYDRVVKMNSPSATESASLSDIDEVLSTLPNVRAKLQANPKLAATGKIPFVDPSYKADYDYLTKTLSSIVGGKNLTISERQIVQTNLPSVQDMFDSATLMKKLDRIERVMGGVKSRMAGGSFGNPIKDAAGRADSAQDATNTDNGDDEEAVFQRLNSIHGGKRGR